MKKEIFEKEVSNRLCELISRCYVANCGNEDKYKIRFAGHVHSIELIHIKEGVEKTTHFYIDVMQDRSAQGVLDGLDGLLSNITYVGNTAISKLLQELFRTCYMLNLRDKKESVVFEYWANHGVEVKFLGRGILDIVFSQRIHYTTDNEYIEFIKYVTNTIRHFEVKYI